MRGMQPRWGYVVTAMVTPFDENNAVDFAEAVALAKWLLDNGSDALVINGTTGESPTTSPKEKAALVKVIVEAIGAEKVIAGVGGNNTAEVIEAVHDAPWCPTTTSPVRKASTSTSRRLPVPRIYP